MLNCTWDDKEAEAALRQLGAHLDEQREAEKVYLKLREAHRQSSPLPSQTATEKNID